MKFGQVADPSQIDFTLPKDHPKTKEILSKSKDMILISTSVAPNGTKPI